MANAYTMMDRERIQERILEVLKERREGMRSIEIQEIMQFNPTDMSRIMKKMFVEGDKIMCVGIYQYHNIKHKLLLVDYFMLKEYFDEKKFLKHAVADDIVAYYSYDRRASLFEDEHRIAKRNEAVMSEKVSDRIYNYIRENKTVSYKQVAELYPTMWKSVTTRLCKVHKIQRDKGRLSVIE